MQKPRNGVQRHNRKEGRCRVFYNGFYSDKEAAAHASDTLARNLMKNGKQIHKLNFPGDYTEVYTEKKESSSKFIGVSYNKKNSNWTAQRWSTKENKTIHKGYYDNEEIAAHASDTLARKLMENGEQKLKLNFPNDHTEIYWKNQNKKKKKTKRLRRRTYSK
jgi:hypothetical protein